MSKTKATKIKKMNNVEAFIDMTDKISNIIDNPCCYCYDKNYLHSNCPWYETGECNPARKVCQISKTVYL